MTQFINKGYWTSETTDNYFCILLKVFIKIDIILRLNKRYMTKIALKFYFFPLSANPMTFKIWHLEGRTSNIQ